MCFYICKYPYIYAQIHMYLSMDLHMYLYVYIHIYIYIYIFIYKYIYTHIYICTYMCLCIYKCIQTGHMNTSWSLGNNWEHTHACVKKHVSPLLTLIWWWTYECVMHTDIIDCCIIHCSAARNLHFVARTQDSTTTRHIFHSWALE